MSLHNQDQVFSLLLLYYLLIFHIKAVIESFLNEIKLLKELKNSPNIVQYIDSEIDRDQGYIYLVSYCVSVFVFVLMNLYGFERVRANEEKRGSCRYV